MTKLNRSREKSSQRGFGLIGMMALLIVVASGATVVYLTAQQYLKARSSSDESVALKWANGLLQGFVLQHGRLPCAATTQLGPEACSDQKAKWLPTQSLYNQASIDASSLTSSMQQMSYAPSRGGAGPTTPDLTAAPGTQSGYVPTVGEVIAYSGGPAVGIAGNLNVPLAGYKSTPSALDFCQALQNIALGISANGLPSDPWSSLAPNAGTYAYTISTGSGSGRNVTVNQLSEVLQCDIVRASVDVLATTASLSVPGGDVLGLQDGLLGVGPGGSTSWVGNGTSGPAGWGSYTWMTKILIPQILAADWLYSAIRTAQLVGDAWKEGNSFTAIADVLLNPIVAAFATAALPEYSDGILRRLIDLGAQLGASADDQLYLAMYQDLVTQLQTMRLWGTADAATGISQADTVVQQAVKFGLAGQVLTTMP